VRRPQLLEAAAGVIAERGIASTRIADIAERAGTSSPAILYWFESKDELLAEALTVEEERFYELGGSARELTGRAGCG
jgi:AcrR family transcriptional regulator